MKSSFLERVSDHSTTRTIDSAEKAIAVPSVPPFTAQMKLAEEEPLQAKAAQPLPLQKAAGPEDELVQGKFTIQKKGDEEEEPLQMMAVQKKGPEEELPVQGKSIIQKKGEEEEPLQMMPIQKKGEEEELPLQGKSIIQKKGDEEEPLQMKAFQFAAYPQGTVQREEAAPAPNRTGMPDNLKSGIENLSGFSMDDVKVHYGSSKPAQLNAHAYAQGTDIHIAPGQEKHLPHEAWHVVQQRQGRVKPTIQAKGIAINDDKGLETEADVMGEKAVFSGTHQQSLLNRAESVQLVAQLASREELIAWSQAHAATAEFKTSGMTNDYVTLRIPGQTIGSRTAVLEFHIHVPKGVVSDAYAGSLYEAGKRSEGDLQAQDEGSLNAIVTTWKASMASQNKTTVDTPEAIAHRATLLKENTAKGDLAVASSSLASISGASTSAELSDEDFVLGLLTRAGHGDKTSLYNMELRSLKAKTTTRDKLKGIYKANAHEHAKTAHTATGSWRKFD